ncbi:MAG: SUMF1/EgtB/PvdO family nonheme iron enzyme [Bacteroidota bacterium]
MRAGKSIFHVGINLFLFFVIASCQRAPQTTTENPCEGDVPLFTSSPSGMVWIPQGPLDDSCMHGFWMDETPVTVGAFEKFVNQTAYVTEAEKFGDAAVFDFARKEWYLQEGANWRFPQGPDQKPAPADHPVTQISWHDAHAYAAWAGKRLPTSREWEHAARNAQNSMATYPWGEGLKNGEKWRANFWQGEFPFFNTGADGFMTTSPVKHFGKSSLGLYDIAGNVWEWVSDPSDIERSNTGPEKLARGGSFLCDLDICHGFQINGQTSSTAETALFHTGFRCVKDRGD